MRKKFTLITLITLLFIGLTGCSKNEEVDPNSKGGYVGDSSEEYYLISFLSGIDYWKEVFKGFEDSAKHFGVKAIYAGDASSDVAKQVDVFEQVVAKNPKGIAIAAVNADALKEPINRAIEQGIQVVTYDSDSPQSNRASYLSTGNREVGAQAAHYFENMVPNGKVALLYTVGAENTEERVAGFEEEIKKSGLSIEVVAKVNDKGDQIEATKNMAATLQADDTIDAIFCMDGVAGVAGPTAVQETGLENKIKVVSFDTDSAVLDMVKNGQIEATVAQGTYSMGYWSMNFLFNLSHDLIARDLPNFVDTGVTFVEIDTVDSYYAK